MHPVQTLRKDFLLTLKRIVSQSPLRAFPARLLGNNMVFTAYSQLFADYNSPATNKFSVHPFFFNNMKCERMASPSGYERYPN